MALGGALSVTLSTIVIPSSLRGTCMAVLFATGLIFGLGLSPMMVSLLSREMADQAALGRASAAVL